MLFKLPETNPQRRIITLCVLLLLVVAAMWQSRNFFLAKSINIPAPDLQVYQYSDDTVTPEAARAALNPTAEIHHHIEAELLAIERARNPEALAALSPLLLPIIEFAATKFSPTTPNISPDAPPQIIPRTVWNYEKILQEPSRWRWQRLHIYGRVARYYKIDYPEYPAGWRQLFFMLVFDEFEQNYFAVLTRALPQNLPPANDDGTVTARRAAYVAFDGMFMLNFPFYIAGIERRKEEVPLFFTENVYLASENRGRGARLDEADDPAGYAEIAPKNRAAGLDTDFLRNKILLPLPRDTENPRSGISALELESAADLRAEKAGLDHIFEYLWDKDAAALAREARDPAMNYVNLVQNGQSSWQIGKAANFFGVALAVQTLRFTDDQFLTSNGINRIYLITAADGRYRNAGKFTWTLATLNLPAPLRRGDFIRADGIFTKLYPYQTLAGDWQWSPLLLCKTIELTSPPPSPLMPRWLVGYEIPLIVMGGIIILALIFFGWQHHKKHDAGLKNLIARARKKSDKI